MILLQSAASLTLVDHQGLVVLNHNTGISSSTQPHLYGEVHLSLPSARQVDAIVVRHVVRYAVAIPSSPRETGVLQSTETHIPIPPYLPKGQHSFPWSLQLPPDTVASAHCVRGSVSHHLEATIKAADAVLRDEKEVLVVKNLSSSSESDFSLHWQRRLLGVVQELGPYCVTLTAPMLMVGGAVDFHLALPSVPKELRIRSISAIVKEKLTLCSLADPRRTFKAASNHLLLRLDSGTQRVHPAASSSAWHPQTMITSTSRPHDTSLLATIDPGTGLELEYHARVPTHDFLHPSTSSDAAAGPIRVTHDVIVDVQFLAPHGKVRSAQMTAPLEISSCAFLPESMMLPAYSRDAARQSTSSSKVTRRLSASQMCACKRDLAQLWDTFPSPGGSNDMGDLNSAHDRHLASSKSPK